MTKRQLQRFGRKAWNNTLGPMVGSWYLEDADFDASGWIGLVGTFVLLTLGAVYAVWNLLR
jgi:hypothetical protein